MFISSTFTFEILIIDLTSIFEASFFILNFNSKYFLFFAHFIILNDVIKNYKIISFMIYFFQLHSICFILIIIFIDFIIVLLSFSSLILQDFVLFYWIIFISISLNHYVELPFFESIYYLIPFIRQGLFNITVLVKQ